MTAPAPTGPTSTRRPPLVLTRTGRELVLVGAILTVAVEVITLLTGWAFTLGTLPLSASFVPALLLLGLLGPRTLGRVDRDRMLPFWIAMAAGLALGGVLFARRGEGIDVITLLVAAADEEVVYRFAVPVVVTAALMVLRLPGGPARVAGYVVGGVWWVLLPGHQAQVETPANLATYCAFAAISALVVSRSRALVPMIVAHCVLNMVTLAHLYGDVSTGARTILAGSLLFLLVGTFAWPERAAGHGLDPAAEGDLVADTVIDLRDGQRRSVRRGDEVEWLDDEPARGASRSDAASEGASRG